MSGENGDPEVLRSLPRTRPARRSTKRAAAAGTGAAAKSPEAVAEPNADGAKPKPKPARKTAPKAAATPKPKSTAARADDLPPAGWAAPADKDDAGSGGLDLIGAATGLVGAVLRRLPRP